MSPINYLLLIGEIEVLKRLYRQVVIPDAVLSELSHESAPAVVREWALRVPEWIKVKPTPSVDSGLLQLDFGEASAIALAGLEGSVLLLIDESAGRRCLAERHTYDRNIRYVAQSGVWRSMGNRFSAEILFNPGS